MSTRLSHVFFSHFASTSFVLESGAGGHRVVFRRSLAAGDSPTAQTEVTGDDLGRVLAS